MFQEIDNWKRLCSKFVGGIFSLLLLLKIWCYIDHILVSVCKSLLRLMFKVTIVLSSLNLSIIVFTAVITSQG